MRNNDMEREDSRSLSLIQCQHCGGAGFGVLIYEGWPMLQCATCQHVESLDVMLRQIGKRVTSLAQH